MPIFSFLSSSAESRGGVDALRIPGSCVACVVGVCSMHALLRGSNTNILTLSSTFSTRGVEKPERWVHQQ